MPLNVGALKSLVFLMEITLTMLVDDLVKRYVLPLVLSNKDVSIF